MASMALVFALTVTLQAEPLPIGRPPDPRTTGPSTRQMPPPEGAQRLAEESDVWVHPGRKEVIVDGRVVLTRGPLEMFACPPQTKEHESIVAVDAKAYLIHAGLLAIGAEPGHPVQFVPEYAPARGSQIEVLAEWVDGRGQTRRVNAQQWIRDSQTGQSLQVPWVFAGSGFWVNPQGERKYLAESGDLICVSNFTTAMLDLPVASSQAESQLLFEAFTERIPIPGTRVRLVLRVKQ